MMLLMLLNIPLFLLDVNLITFHVGLWKWAMTTMEYLRACNAYDKQQLLQWETGQPTPRDVDGKRPFRPFPLACDWVIFRRRAPPLPKHPKPQGPSQTSSSSAIAAAPKPAANTIASAQSALRAAGSEPVSLLSTPGQERSEDANPSAEKPNPLAVLRALGQEPTPAALATPDITPAPGPPDVGDALPAKAWPSWPYVPPAPAVPPNVSESTAAPESPASDVPAAHPMPDMPNATGASDLPVVLAASALPTTLEAEQEARTPEPASTSAPGQEASAPTTETRQEESALTAEPAQALAVPAVP